MNKYIIAPSILAADAARLGEEVQAVLRAGADCIHIDVLDNHYAPNLAFGPHFCKALRDYGITAPLEVHLAINSVNNLIPAFAQAGASIITIHPETTHNLNESLALIHSFGLKAGLAFSPDIPLTALNRLENKIEFISILGVAPGFGGQTFLLKVIKKIKEARLWINQNSISTNLGVDGGIHLGNIQELLLAGADTFMIGTGIFNTNNYCVTINAFRKKINECHLKLHNIRENMLL